MAFQNAGYKEDFEQERRDREKIHKALLAQQDQCKIMKEELAKAQNELAESQKQCLLLKKQVCESEER